MSSAFRAEKFDPLALIIYKLKVPYIFNIRSVETVIADIDIIFIFTCSELTIGVANGRFAFRFYSNACQWFVPALACNGARN